MEQDLPAHLLGPDGYEFPANPVRGLPGHADGASDAVTVDALAAPVYYWRERESGESITQQKFQYGNLVDRVVSAEMVLDLVDDGGSGRPDGPLQLPRRDRPGHPGAGVLDRPEQELDRLLALGHRLVDRLALSWAPPVRPDPVPRAAGQRRRCCANWPPSATRAVWSAASPPIAPASPVAVRRRLPRSDRSTAPMSAYTFPVTSLQHRTLVTGLRWTDGTLRVRGTAEIPRRDGSGDLDQGQRRERHQPPPVAGRTVQHARPAQPAGSRRLRGDPRPRRPRRRANLIWPLRFEVDVTAGGLRRHGLLRSLQPGSASYPPGRWLADGQWVQPGRARGGVLALQSDLDPTTLLDVTADGDHLVLTGRIPGRSRHADLRISRPIRDRQWSCESRRRPTTPPGPRASRRPR